MNNLQDLDHQPLLASPSPDDISLSLTTHVHNDNVLAFLRRVDTIQDSIGCLEQSLHRLQRCVEQSKQSQTPHSLTVITVHMKSVLDEWLKQATSIKDSLASLDEDTAESRALAGCEKGTSVDRIRTFVSNGLRQKLNGLMADFGSLMRSMEEDQKDLISRTYYALTGKQPNGDVFDQIMEAGDGEDLLRKAIERQGITPNIHIIQEIHERQSAVKTLEEDLTLLQQLFLDLSVLVENQGVELDDIEKNMLESLSFTKIGHERLDEASQVNRINRKCYVAVLVSLLVLTAAITIAVVIVVVYIS